MKFLINLLVILTGCFPIAMDKTNPSQAEDKIVYKLVAKECFSNGAPVKIKFILENGSDKTLFFLKWYTPFEGCSSDMFKITGNGKEIQYEGRMVKRGNQRFEDYLSINPSSSIDTVLDLSSLYNLKDRGEYRIEYRGKIYDYIFAADAKNAEELFLSSPDKQKMVDISGNSLNLKVGKCKSR